MHIVTVIGNSKVGKTALCQQWSTGAMSTSYLSTITVDHYNLPGLTVHDTPSDARFHTKLEVYLASTDVFVLVGNQDKEHDPWWARIQLFVPDASWLFVWTGSGACPKRRLWASTRSIPVAHVDLEDPQSVENALSRLRSSTLNHAPHPERIPLGYYDFFVGEARPWLPCI